MERKKLRRRKKCSPLSSLICPKKKEDPTRSIFFSRFTVEIKYCLNSKIMLHLIKSIVQKEMSNVLSTILVFIALFFLGKWTLSYVEDNEKRLIQTEHKIHVIDNICSELFGELFSKYGSCSCSDSDSDSDSSSDMSSVDEKPDTECDHITV